MNPSSSNRRNEMRSPKSLLKRRKLRLKRQKLQVQQWLLHLAFLLLACRKLVGFLRSRGFPERQMLLQRRARRRFPAPLECQVHLIQQTFLKHLVPQARQILIHRQLRLRLLSRPHQLQVFPPHLVLQLRLVRLEHRTYRKPLEHQLHLRQSLHQLHLSHRAPRRFLNHHLVPACRLPLPLGSPNHPNHPSRQHRQSLLRMARRQQASSS